MTDRALGYLLIFVGICIMAFALSQVYLLFTNKTSPYEVFKTSPQPQQQLTTEQLIADPSAAAKLQTEMFSAILQKEMGKSLNIGASLFFMYFVMTFGYRLSLIGVQLARPIKVTLRGKTIHEKETANESDISP